MEVQSPYDARDVANYLLDCAQQRRQTLSITSVLKLVYFAHGWCLAKYGRPLIGQKFEAWKNGPVVRVLYDEFKSSSGGPITHRAKKFCVEHNEYIYAEDKLSAIDMILLDDILSAYGHHHPFALSDMTHVKGSPWSVVWDAGQKGLAPGMKIPNETIRSFFEQRNVGDTFNA